MDNWDTMLELASSRPSGLRELVEKHSATTCPEIAGALLGVLYHLQREGPVPASEARSALFGLVRSLKVWELAPWTPEGMMNTLFKSIHDDCVPGDADLPALAELIERAASQDESFGPRLELLNTATIPVCSSLVNCGLLLTVLACRPGARESVTRGIEAMKRRSWATEDDLYADEIEYVLEALRGVPAAAE